MPENRAVLTLHSIRSRSLLLSVFTLWLWACATFSAYAVDNDANLEQQRKWFERAERLATKPRNSEFQRLKEKLADYPLQPYLTYRYLHQFPYLSNLEQIDDFLTEYADTPMDEPLRERWLSYLANKNRVDLFIEYYRPTGSTKLDCTYADYLERAGQTTLAMQKAEQLWMVGNSQPSACDRIFAVWTKAGLRTEQHVWKRLSLAADGGSASLVPYLTKLLPEQKRYLGELFLNVRRSPSQVSKLSKFPATFPEQEQQILIYGLGRLIWRNADLALVTYRNAQSRFAFTIAQQAELAQRFAIALAIEEHHEAEVWMETAATLGNDEEVLRWHLAHALKHQQWHHVMDITNIADTQELSFAYWRARGFEQLGSRDAALPIFNQLAEQRHYYGFLASGKLKKMPSLSDAPLNFSAQQLDAVSSLPAARRAYEFLQLERYTSARREWLGMQNGLPEQQRLVAAVIADQWGWHDQAILAFGRTGYLDDVKRRFPLAYTEQLLPRSEKYNVEPEWALAITRRESSFMVDANSSAGARGLMQLMPSTARYLAQQKISNRALFDPEQNVEFGTQYMRYLMDKMDNNPLLATASYNAGWRRVKEWVPANGSMPADVWIENIPYKETRNYVKAVMAYKQIYATLLGKQSSLFEELVEMQISASNLTF
ncbi:lytic transglycosylase domain-containing protein [Aestuariibacter salexigens]|uniref:lytic transglycosylase domain-containing protein n=1 Tax=Aestuariibacter salexigens TaxID=226010 RepID=UPI0004104CAB|nr:lytic transglycosylase domain-containing protein [Aestuariibacter salexigens]